MKVHNTQIAERFNRLAELLEIQGANPFRIRAYRKAAQTIESLPHSMAGIFHFLTKLVRNCPVNLRNWRRFPRLVPSG
jgi:DNA polymerase/3'-5' exonuclease PolX